MVRNVIRLARDLGMTSVAEDLSAKRPPLWAELAELGCDQIQGYVLTPPLPADELVDWLTHHTANDLGRPTPATSRA